MVASMKLRQRGDKSAPRSRRKWRQFARRNFAQWGRRQEVGTTISFSSRATVTSAPSHFAVTRWIRIKLLHLLSAPTPQRRRHDGTSHRHLERNTTNIPLNKRHSLNRLLCIFMYIRERGGRIARLEALLASRQ